MGLARKAALALGALCALAAASEAEMSNDMKSAAKLSLAEQQLIRQSIQASEKAARLAFQAKQNVRAGNVKYLPSLHPPRENTTGLHASEDPMNEDQAQHFYEHIAAHAEEIMAENATMSLLAKQSLAKLMEDKEKAASTRKTLVSLLQDESKGHVTKKALTSLIKDQKKGSAVERAALFAMLDAHPPETKDDETVASEPLPADLMQQINQFAEAKAKAKAAKAAK